LRAIVIGPFRVFDRKMAKRWSFQADAAALDDLDRDDSNFSTPTQF
jgi:hypothetical protein